MEATTSETELDDADPRKRLSPPAPSPRGRPPPNTGNIVAPEELLSDAREFVGELSRSDKIAFGGACLIAVSCFLPWKETAAEGEILGLMSMGVGALLGAVVIISAIFVRVRRTMPKLNPLVPWMVQLSVAFFCIIYSVVFMRVALDSNEVPSAIGNQMIMNSSPSFGVFLGLLGALVALVGSLLGLKERT